MAHVAFVGLGFGGLYTLRHLVAQMPPDVTVTAVDRLDRFVFRPLLYEYLAGELEVDVVAPPFGEVVPEGVELIRGDAVEIASGDGRVGLADGRVLDYDVLVLAPGSEPAFHGVRGAREHGFPFYSFDDAERLRSALQLRAWAEGPRPACVVGGGVVGIELAFALSELLARRGRPAEAGRVIVLEAMPDILAGMSPGVRASAKRRLAAAGIDVHTGVEILEVEDEAVQFRAGKRRERIDAAVVAWTAGIRPSPLVDQLPAKRHGKHGVAVEPSLQLSRAPAIFVVGDAISYPGPVEGSPLPDTAQAAVQEADVCAVNLRRFLTDGKAPREFRYDPMGEFLRTGEGRAIASVKGAVIEGRAAALIRRATYLAKMPAWAVRSAAFRQWLG